MNNWFRHKEDVGILVLRLFVGARLMWGVQDNILHWEHLKEFEAFLAQHRFPLPLVSAILSVYAQAAAGVLFIIGWQLRPAATVMILNFLVAVLMVHLGQTFEQMTAVLFMLVSSVVLLFTGAGRYATGKNSRAVIFQPEHKHNNIKQQRK